eukprot:TRINITY_DN5094_c0_g1_i2.p1 TRINITY_DN5094_c0_g1~~TRINITY_DN5094_c0_g1_i2.p1  ORF type:complete len:1055 (+),score=127.56 TRINITY_DN5094_c0_g1_i2:86-3250(+)
MHSDQHRVLLDEERILDFFVQVQLRPKDCDSRSEPQELYHYPRSLREEDQPLLAQIPKFCFPDISLFPKRRLAKESKFFSFTLTDTAGNRRNAYCYRKLIGESLLTSDKLWPTAFCVVSPLPYSCFFQAFLAATYKVSHSVDQLNSLLSYVYYGTRPSPGMNLVYKGSDTEFNFRRPNEWEYVHGNLNCFKIFQNLDTTSILNLFCALLCERRVVFFSSNPGTLGDCVSAALSLLAPFSWQYVFIPILPPDMIDMVCAPMPFVCGVLSMHSEQVMSMPMEEVVLVDIEGNQVITPACDHEILPMWIREELIDALHEAKKMSASVHNPTSQRPRLQQVLEPAFYRAFTVLLSGFEQHIIPNSGKVDPKWIDTCDAENVDFVKRITCTQMFNRFIRAWQANKSGNGIPEQDWQKVSHFKEEYLQSNIEELKARSCHTTKNTVIRTGNLYILEDDDKWNSMVFTLTSYSLTCKGEEADKEPLFVVPIENIHSVQIQGEEGRRAKREGIEIGGRGLKNSGVEIRIAGASGWSLTPGYGLTIPSARAGDSGTRRKSSGGEMVASETPHTTTPAEKESGKSEAKIFRAASATTITAETASPASKAIPRASSETAISRAASTTPETTILAMPTISETRSTVSETTATELGTGAKETKETTGTKETKEGITGTMGTRTGTTGTSSSGSVIPWSVSRTPHTSLGPTTSPTTTPHTSGGTWGTCGPKKKSVDEGCELPKEIASTRDMNILTITASTRSMSITHPDYETIKQWYELLLLRMEVTGNPFNSPKKKQKFKMFRKPASPASSPTQSASSRTYEASLRLSLSEKRERRSSFGEKASALTKAIKSPRLRDTQDEGVGEEGVNFSVRKTHGHQRRESECGNISGRRSPESPPSPQKSRRKSVRSDNIPEREGKSRISQKNENDTNTRSPRSSHSPCTPESPKSKRKSQERSKSSKVKDREFSDYFQFPILSPRSSQRSHNSPRHPSAPPLPTNLTSPTSSPGEFSIVRSRSHKSLPEVPSPSVSEPQAPHASPCVTVTTSRRVTPFGKSEALAHYRNTIGQ